MLGWRWGATALEGFFGALAGPSRRRLPKGYCYWWRRARRAMDLYPGSQKRKTVWSEIARESKRHKSKGICIDYGCKFSLSSGLLDGLGHRLIHLLKNSDHMSGISHSSPITLRKRTAYRKSSRQDPKSSSLALAVGMTSGMAVHNVPRGRSHK